MTAFNQPINGSCKIKKKEFQRGSTGIWTRIVGFKVQSDNQLHHRTTVMLMSVKIDCFIHIPDGIRTRNLKIRSLTPYPLGHGDIFACAVEIIQRLGLINACARNIFFCTQWRWILNFKTLCMHKIISLQCVTCKWMHAVFTIDIAQSIYHCYCTKYLPLILHCQK